MVSLAKNAGIKDQLTLERVPALSAKSVISFFIDAKLYKQERRTSFGHGLGHEEKKNTASDYFELHLDSELGNSRNVEVVLIGFFAPKQGNLEPTILPKLP